jgi:hypothetical protein
VVQALLGGGVQFIIRPSLFRRPSGDLSARAPGIHWESIRSEKSPKQAAMCPALCHIISPLLLHLLCDSIGARRIYKSSVDSARDSRMEDVHSDELERPNGITAYHVKATRNGFVQRHDVSVKILDRTARECWDPLVGRKTSEYLIRG